MRNTAALRLAEAGPQIRLAAAMTVIIAVNITALINTSRR